MDEPITWETLLEEYKVFHIRAELDHDINSLARIFLASKEYDKIFERFQFYELTKEFLRKSAEKTSVSKALVFKDLQKAYQILEDYGIRLLKYPWRKEFCSIKLFTTFFKHELESKLPNAASVLELYGYKEESKNIIKISEPLDFDRIFSVSFELFLSRIELEVLYESCSYIENYTEDFSLVNLLRARKKVRDDVENVVEYFCRTNKINTVKRMKTNDKESEKKLKGKYEKRSKVSAEDEESSRFDSNKGNMINEGRSTRDTKYPPTSDRYPMPIENLSDADLYGHPNGSPKRDDYTPMETHEDVPCSGRTYDLKNYGGIRGDTTENGYENMDMYGGANGGSHHTTFLPPPTQAYKYTRQEQELPPPTYDQATQKPGTDYVMVEVQDSRAGNSADVLSNTISTMNIRENGLDNHGSRLITEVGVPLGTYDIPPRRALQSGLGNAVYSSGSHYQTVGTYDIPRTALKSGLGDAVYSSGSHNQTVGTYDIPPGALKSGPGDVVYSSESHYQTVPQRGTTDVKGYNFSASEKNTYENFAAFDKDYRSPISSTKGLERSQLYDKPSSISNLNRRPNDPSMGGVDLKARSASLGSYDTRSTQKGLYTVSPLTGNESNELTSKGSTNTYVPKTTVTYVTSSSSKGSLTAVTSSMSSYKGTVTTRSQSREMAAKRSEVLSEPSQSSSRTDKTTTDQYSKCSVCSSKATQCCKRCNIRSCIVCQNVVARLRPCENGKEHLFVEESPRRMSGKEKDLGFRVQENNTCSFCDASSPSHNCIYCNKKSCATCHIRYTNDDCASNSSKRHYFETQPPQNVTPKREDVTTSKVQTTPLAKDEGLQPDEENICDFCGLTSKLICNACLKTVCDTCLYVYKQDLCQATKKEHRFENINAPSTEAADKDSSWNCERCTFLNSPSHRICAVCATSRGKQVEVLPKSGSRKCGNCTFGNEEGARVCKMCACTVGFDKPESYI